MTSAPRVERVDDLVVDSQGLDPPTEKWLQAAREAADTDGIRENAYAERLQMCISCCTLMCMFPMVPNMYRVSHSRYVSERVSPSYTVIHGLFGTNRLLHCNNRFRNSPTII